MLEASNMRVSSCDRTAPVTGRKAHARDGAHREGAGAEAERTAATIIAVDALQTEDTRLWHPSEDRSGLFRYTQAVMPRGSLFLARPLASEDALFSGQ